MFTRDPDASFDTPNVVIGRQGRNELTLSFRPAPYLHRLLKYTFALILGVYSSWGAGERRGSVRYDPGGRLPRLGCQTVPQGPG